MKITSSHVLKTLRRHAPYKLAAIKTDKKNKDPVVWEMPEEKENPLHAAIKNGTLASVKKVLKTHPWISLDSLHQGKTPLHLAVKKEKISILNFLLEKGANPYVANKKGITPVYVAARHKYYPGVRSLLKSMEIADQKEDFWYQKKDLKNILSSFHHKYDPHSKWNEPLDDELTEKLTGQHAEDFNETFQIYKYISHLNSWVGETLRADDEGWWPDQAMVQRIRTLSHILAAKEELPPHLLHRISAQDFSAKMLGELQTMLETLKMGRQVDAIIRVDNEGLKNQLIERLSLQTLKKALSMQPGMTLTIPAGSSEHALYIDVEKEHVGEEEFLVLHVNNLGDGSESHDVGRGGRIYPFGFKVPLSSRKETKGLLEELFTDVLSICASYEEEDCTNLYASLENIKENLSLIYGKQAVHVDPVAMGWKAMKGQTAGNCVLKNHTASLISRHGKFLGAWIKKREIQYAMDRSENIISEGYFQQKEMEKDEEILFDLIYDEDVEGLRAFLKKPRCEGVAASFDSEELTSLIDLNEPKLFSQLVDLGADIFDVDKNGRSLLHYAVSKGQFEISRFLLEKGLSPFKNDHFGLSALDYARQNGFEQIRVLFEALA